MRYIIVILLICSSTHLFSMSRYYCVTMRGIHALRSHIPQPKRPTVCPIRTMCSQSDKTHERQKLEHEKQRIQRQKTALLYSRPILTVSGVAVLNYIASTYGLTQPEHIASLMAAATLNTGVYHAADERCDRRLEAIQAELDKLD